MQGVGFSSLPFQVRLAAILLLGLAGFVIWDQLHWWRLRDDYSFGFLVPLFVAYVLHDRWPAIRGFFGQRWGPLRAGPTAPLRIVAGAVSYGLFAGGGGLLFLGALYRAAEGAAPAASMPIALGFGLFVMATVYLLSDRNVHGERTPVDARARLALMFLFPAMIWLLSAPTFGVLETWISTYLLDKVAIFVYHSFEFSGFPIVREGSVLILPSGEVGVEDACSGIRSMTACLFAGSFLGAIFLDRLWKKASLVCAAMLLAFLTNLLRSLFLTVWAYRYGPEAIDGAIHDATGYGIVFLTVLGLFLLLPVFNFRLEVDDEDLAAS